MNWHWLRRKRPPTNGLGQDAREARVEAERKLADTQALGGRVERAAVRLEDVMRENHLRIKMEQAFKGHG